MHKIKDLNDPRIAAYRSLKGKELERDGIFMAEGDKVVDSMVDSGCKIASCLITMGAVPKYKKLIGMMEKAGASVYAADDEVIEGIIGFRFHKGVMAVGYCPKKTNILEGIKKIKRPRLLVALDGINDPQNVGLITRNALAFGAAAIVVDGATYDPYYRKAVRVSMGAIFRLPVYYEENLAASLKELKKIYGMRIVAATPGNGAIDIGKADLSGDICLVFGNEDRGVSRKVLKMADAKVRIPISGDVDSLNVASAAAVCLHEISRRRKGPE